MADAYPDAIGLHRPRLQQLYADHFAAHDLEAIAFPTAPVLPAPIDAVNGSGTPRVDGGPLVDTFTTTIRNVGPGSCVGVPSLSLPAGRTRGGQPVGPASRGPSTTMPACSRSAWPVEGILETLPAPPPS